MVTELFKYITKKITYINKLPKNSKNIIFQNRDFDQDLASLKKDGTLILENFIPANELEFMQNEIKIRIEEKFDFELPCLSQTKIDRDAHKEIIQNKFKYSNERLNKEGICFSKCDIKNYSQVLTQFKPSTLKLYTGEEIEYFNLWLHPYLMRLVESYMGIIPDLVEAYIRRNFPSDFKVMNHNWHRDTNHEHYLLKAFFFFTDCDIQHGPHEFVIGSHLDLSL